MRLICPNCGAQYEVADDVIPADGRDVQCSNCGHTWFENHGASDAEDVFAPADPAPATDTPDADTDAQWPETDPAPAAPATPQEGRQGLDPAIADILREEAAREAAARDREAANVESQPDLGLDTAQAAPDQRSAEAQQRMASLRGETAQAATPAAAATRRELLPDIEEINSSLRSSSERTDTTDAPADEPAKKRRGFRRGFFGVLLILAILTAIYVYAPQISNAVPAVSDTLASYVAMVDNARLWIDLKLQDMLAAMDAET